jgi:hypothetical protein
VQDRGIAEVSLSLGSRVLEGSDSMDKGDQAKDNLEEKWLDVELYLNNRM